ncbi:MAG: 3-dehydro-L-gulonate 2-dehydrogenase [Chitinophagaceae bacterium]|nr:3-dehydro-L-gulonate 2-dehydrogenase [Chitinophagaceae bacterium]
MPGKEDILVPYADMKKIFSEILLKQGFTEDKAGQCAEIFTASSADGVYTHGVNRFPTFVSYIKKGYVKPAAEPSLKNSSGSMEQWDGNLGPGPLNAIAATDRAMQLADQSGIGCVALSNTNHWMRGGTYGWYAAKKGYAFIGFTNTIANMPVWGGKDKKLGNNPLIIAIPYKKEAIVLDMAMSQYSIGSLQQAKMKGERLAVNGGFDADGNLTNDPAAIIGSKRPLPVGYWKGAGMALLLDMLAVLLSGGLATHEISSKQAEYGLSQVFIAIDLSKLHPASSMNNILEAIILDYHSAEKADADGRILYPGERILATRKRNLEKGIPVLRAVWEEIGAL